MCVRISMEIQSYSFRKFKINRRFYEKYENATICRIYITSGNVVYNVPKAKYSLRLDQIFVDVKVQYGKIYKTWSKYSLKYPSSKYSSELVKEWNKFLVQFHFFSCIHENIRST